MNMQNLDLLCAQSGYEMCKEVNQQYNNQSPKVSKAKTENLFTRSLGVLQENGVYAFFLYLASRSGSEKKGAEKLKEQAGLLLREAKINPLEPVDDPLETVRGLAENLDDLLLAKRLLEQALIYARYHAKALGD